ncbi:MAG: outer membrane protein assembly factor BamC [SAR86 cluster bacterium]|jgi:outer membrane protein assembly factor BamC|uniref:Outer membrane protein assembly factor BamC n=1 Tax=SAR86 cluster bacterium TaxID=2030880 RepID=A0A520N0S8_9GAMM|nr:MAG: outer membrane protein assembly factor BamC [SAR86 cluster bacterium]
MKHLFTFLPLIFFVTSCSIIGGPNGYFPEKKYDFLEEEIEADITLPSDLDSPDTENHYPVGDPSNLENVLEVPKPRQIFSSSGDSSVQLRRLGELMWIYIETLPSTSWPISKNYWDTSEYDVIKADPVSGEIDIDFSQSSKLQMRVEHGIKEASTEVFLYKINKISGDIESDPEFVQMEMEKMIDYYADSLSNFTGTSLAAQNLNEMKKAKIFTEDGMTVISLDLNFDRAWSSVSKALNAAEIVTNDRDRSNGTFYVSFAEKDERRFRLFGGRSSSDNSQNNEFGKSSQFEITITQENNKSYVRAISKNGNIDESELLLSKINESLS